MPRRYRPPPGHVHIATMLFASYHVEYLMAECRQIRMPILYYVFGASETSSGIKPRVNRSSNGVTSEVLVLRERDLFEFMLRWSEYVSGVSYHSATQDWDFREHQKTDYIVDLPEMAPYREAYRKYWRM